MIQFVHMKKIAEQFTRFALVGFVNTGVDFITYAFLTRVFLFWDEHKVLATSIAFIVANINSYVMNNFWTFKDKEKDHHKKYFKFLIVSLVGLGLTAVIFYLLLQLGLYDLLAKIGPIPVVLLWNFLINKYWTFKNRQI